MYDEESPVYRAYAEQFSILHGFYQPNWHFSVDSLPQLFPLYEEFHEVTEELKAEPVLIRLLNPIIYEEVDDICHWASLFRYVKSKAPSAWKKFVSDIKSIPLPPPAVKTPVSLNRPTPTSSASRFQLPPEFVERMRHTLDSVARNSSFDGLQTN